MKKKNKDVSFVDLKKQYLSIKNEVDHKIFEILDNTAFVLGDELKLF